ncbi:QueT transporter family protein [Jeotgalibaca ciconiae]|uniref:QueT transporter family protein n=1 Tax=Jeotgalibaca ciconiae TaxID=2496265 RepID=A0A3S9H9T1_9LACT|nr:QueT transporter family protein [Jeotgalibaca ciconiae]AZP04071.1 QueT transporter family protein [Jeotgalibaca ciconiae]HJB22955.1 QueT transporter family protein [Candidatus Jeotgalibaca pullicola]
MNTKRMVTNTIIAALYVAMTGIFSFMSFGAVQFRVSEMLNHLIGYHRSYKYGVLAGVFISNLIFSTLGAWDLVFGFGQTFISFLILEKLFKPNDSETKRMILTTMVFTATMIFVAVELYIVLDLPFWFSFLTTAIGELVVLLVSAPLMQYLNKLIGFTERMN